MKSFVNLCFVQCILLLQLSIVLSENIPTFAPTSVAQSYQWSQSSILYGTNAGSSSGFGSASIDGNDLAIGAYKQGAQDVGAVYYYVKSGSLWSQQSILLTHDSASGDQFGVGVAVKGNMLLVGAFGDDGNVINVGSVYVYNKISSKWTFSSKMTPPDVQTGSEGQGYGRDLAFDDTTLFISGWHDNTQFFRAGAMYVFDRVDTTKWSYQAKLFSPSPHESDLFGTVAVYGDDAFVASYSYDSTYTDDGRVWVYKRLSSKWSCVSYLDSPNAAAGDIFGNGLAIYNDVAFIGAPLSDQFGTDAGAVSLYKKISNAWTYLSTLQPPSTTATPNYGGSISFDGQNLVVGAGKDSTIVSDGGVAYIYSHLYLSSTPTVSPTLTPTFFPSSIPTSNPTLCTGLFQYAFGAMSEDDVLFTEYLLVGQDKFNPVLQRTKAWKLGINTNDHLPSSNLTVLARLLDEDELTPIGEWFVQTTFSEVVTSGLKSLQGLNTDRHSNLIIGAMVEDVNHQLHYYSVSACERAWSYQAALQLDEYVNDISDNKTLQDFNSILK